MKIPINLATNPFINYRRFVLTASVLAVTAVALTTVVWMESVNTWRDRTTARTRLRELSARHAELVREQLGLERELETPATQALLARTQFLNQLIQQKGLSWLGLFFDLQEQLPNRVRVISLSPSLRDDGSLQIDFRVAGESAPAIISFLQALERDPSFREVVPVSQRREPGSSDAVMSAQVSAVYVQERNP